MTQEDFRRILTQPENAIIKQQIALLKVENVDLEFAEDARRNSRHCLYNESDR